MGSMGKDCCNVFGGQLVVAVGLFCVVSFGSWFFQLFDGVPKASWPIWLIGLVASAVPFGLFPGVPLVLIIAILSLLWVFSPVLHLIKALFSLFGLKPKGREHAIQGAAFNNFWLLVLVLQIAEQFLEVR